MTGPLAPSHFGCDRFTVPAVLDRRAELNPDLVMMTIAGTDVTFAQMRQRSRAAANLLADLGVGRGDRVALFTATCPEWVYIWLGAARLGAVSAAVNTANKCEFLLHALRLAQAKLIFTDAERRSRVGEVAGGLEVPSVIVPLDDSLNAAICDSCDRPPADNPTGPGGLGCLFYTSGTTGPSKAVATSWHYLFSVAAAVSSAWDLRAGEVLWTAMPLFHLSAAPSVLAPMLVGATTVLAGGFHPTQVWDDVRARNAVGFAGAGAMVSMLRGLPADGRDAQLPLRFISAAPIDAESHHDIEKRYGCRIATMYGMTEAFPIAVKPVAEEGIPGTSGRPSPNFEVLIVDPEGGPLPVGSVGEIACRARYPHVMSEGYVAPGRDDFEVQPHPEWFRTGDLGRLDPDRNLTYVDRIKDSLRRRGENVSSVEVETVVMRYPAVAEAAAVGVPSELGEDDILLVVTLCPGAAPDYPELLDFCAARMPYFCVPRFVEAVADLPKTAIGRIRKDLLRERGPGVTAWDREKHGYTVSR